MILIHELGHYWAARFFDVRVETFSFGFGPRLFGFRKGETDFRFSVILFGGYVKMAGEQPGEETQDPRGFMAKPRWQRLIIAAAGPVMNILLAVALLTGLYMYKYPKAAATGGPAVIGHVAPDSAAAKADIRAGDTIARIGDVHEPTWEQVFYEEVESANRELTVIVRRGGESLRKTITPAFDERLGMGVAGWTSENEIQIAGVMQGMDAERAGLKTGDILVSVNGQPIRSTVKLQEVIAAAGGKPVDIVYARDGERKKVTVQPAKMQHEGEERLMIGVQLEARVAMVQLPFGEALKTSIRQNINNAALIYKFLRGVIERRMSAKSISGPIHIAQLSGAAAREGADVFIGLMAMVSLNLAVFNLLPIPILDGGVILLLLIEMIMRRDLSLQVKEAVFKLGFVFLMAVVVFVIYNDITKMMPQG
jgi:regulator of sigma E protease